MTLRAPLLLALLASFALVPSAHAQPAYNELRQKSSHNSYQRHEAVLDQLVYHRIRSLEFDIHTGKSGWSKTAGNWFVYHDDNEPETTCHRLSDCLEELRAFHLANPNHEVVTVWVDLKDPFETGRLPQDLDARITTHLPSAWLFKPSDVMAACPGVSSLQAALTGACTWPTHTALRGRFVFVLTGGDVSSSTSKLNTYVSNGTTATSRVAFIAPDLKSTSGIGTRQYAVFFNMENTYAPLSTDVHLANFIGRVWGVNDTTSWSRAVSLNTHHVATDKVSYHMDPWAVTHNGLGWPFQCLEGWPCASNQEAVDSLGVEVDSGDIWSSSDSFLFAHESNSAVTTTTWTASVSTPNSHVDEWAKGCLMVRAGTTATARYFAICRAADNHKLRVQYRTSTSGASTAAEVDILPADTVDQESLTFLRLTVQYDGAQTCASGYGSQNGSTWKLIASQCFSGLLANQGLAVSSHGSGKVKLLFGNVKRDTTLYRAASFPNKTAIGGASSWRVFDGFF
ncbi:Ca2+-dependent phosphoinositide-specific phospholipase C [Hyalangium rubrum]|uniref:Ca2+-dependent phosphoinositide-specific phospholipase C n=1 Tax=Hyalangium rubrum TaxID=3103134 RepID=A0ABU5HIJ8_9BACT|nr:Ca2+-dependent phosphoinositide-specific phospholipase C [Hyalangium sp. s54d21]MDY7233286.1 Ca2+-dependent phosphoinositide-specific phospholipase C [Hyalangium sp. s54d21]